MRFEELTDDQWKLLVPSIPLPAYTGRPRANDRNYIYGILYVLRSGCRWMDMPTVPTRQSGNDTRNRVLKVYGKIKYYQVPSVTGIFFWIDKDRRPFRG